MAVSFPFSFGQKRAIRSTPNPMDKATIFSIYPKPLDEIHHTIQPGRFLIAAGTYENPAHLVVGPSSWWREIDEFSPLLEIPNSSVQVADAVVKGYCQGLLGYNGGDAMPGLFWIPGALTIRDLKTNPQLIAELKKAKDRQDKYFSNLIKMADALWSKSNGNPLAISDDMRIAAKELGANKDWTANFALVDNVKCSACGSPRNPAFPICPNCKSVIDPDKFKALGMKFAE